MCDDQRLALGEIMKRMTIVSGARKRIRFD